MCLNVFPTKLNNISTKRLWCILTSCLLWVPSSTSWLSCFRVPNQESCPKLYPYQVIFHSATQRAPHTPGLFTEPWVHFPVSQVWNSVFKTVPGVRKASDSVLNMDIQSNPKYRSHNQLCLHLTEYKMRLTYAQRNEEEEWGTQTVGQEGHVGGMKIRTALMKSL